MTTAMLKIKAIDVERAAELMIRQSGTSESILRAARRVNECRSDESERAALIWEMITARLRSIIPADQHPENQASSITDLEWAA